MRARASRPEFLQMDKIRSEIEMIYIAPRAVWQIMISYLAQARPQLYEGFLYLLQN